MKVVRWTAIAGIVLTVGVAGAATRLKRPSAGDACLCTPDTEDAPALATTPRPSGSTASFARIGGVDVDPSTSSAGLLPPYAGGAAASVPVGTASGDSAGRAGSVGWGGRSRAIGAYSAASGGHSPAMGGLWRLMNWGRHRAPEHKATGSRQVSTATRRPAGGNSMKPPSRAPSGAVTSAPTLTAPTGLFTEQATPIPSLLGGNGAPGLGTGGAIGSAGVSTGLATTPEPGSIILLGTGVLGFFGVLRRRRAW